MQNENKLNDNKKIKVVFVCHGNICRSPMAEFVMKELVRRAGLEKEFSITSAAVTAEEQGNPIYPQSARKLQEKGIPFGNHRAHRITPQEYEDNDLVIVMDASNRRLLSRIAGEPSDGKVHLLMEYAGSSADVADPWYTGDFETAYRDIFAGCSALLGILSGKTEV